MKLAEAQLKLAKAEGQREALENAVAASKAQIASLEQRSNDIAQAVLAVQKIANELRANITAFFTTCVQSALDIVFPGSYKFCMEFNSRRDQAELDMWLDRNGEKVSALDAAGGGVVDVISFALRTCCLLLSKKRPVLFLDEPFKFIRGEARDRLGELLNLLSVQSHVQIIMVADVAGTPIEGAKRFRIGIEGGVSRLLPVEG